jgi:hypothetical protein
MAARAPLVAKLRSLGLKTLQESLADAAEANVRRYVVERDLAAAGDTGNPKNGIAICRNKHVIVGLRNPRAQVCRCFVGEPLLQGHRVVLVVGEAKLRN